MDDSYPTDIEGLDGVYPARQARSRVAQDRLLKAGNIVFASKGYDDAYVTEIASVAGYSIGTFYARFRDKDALFSALQYRFTRRGRDNIDKFFDLKRWDDASLDVVIAAYIEGTARLLSRNAGFFRALYQRSLVGDASVHWPALRAGTRIAGLKLAELVRRKAPEADRPDLDSLCIFCLRTVEGMLMHRLLHWKVDEEFGQDYILQSLTLMTTSTLNLRQA
ncbi:MAG: TetR/AcrR family transcriptional regulator [Phenylobacterium sp.]|nr:TetR/AcrR family transcriptional regulator [Phenylobacterium sp.]